MQYWVCHTDPNRFWQNGPGKITCLDKNDPPKENELVAPIGCWESSLCDSGGSIFDSIWQVPVHLPNWVYCLPNSDEAPDALSLQPAFD
jgi:hypothetical protein